MSSVAYWYATQPAAAIAVPSAAQRRAVRRASTGEWLVDEESQITSRTVPINDEMKRLKEQWQQQNR